MCQQHDLCLSSFSVASAFYPTAPLGSGCVSFAFPHALGNHIKRSLPILLTSMCTPPPPPPPHTHTPLLPTPPVGQSFLTSLFPVNFLQDERSQSCRRSVSSKKLYRTHTCFCIFSYFKPNLQMFVNISSLYLFL